MGIHLLVKYISVDVKEWNLIESGKEIIASNLDFHLFASTVYSIDP